MMKKGEGAKHITAKARIEHYLQAHNWSVFLEAKLPKVTIEGQQVQWIADILAIKKDVTLILEVDGNVGHTTTQAQAQDRARDQMLFELYGLITVRFPTPWVIGEFALEYHELQDEIEHQCKVKYKRQIKVSQ